MLTKGEMDARGCVSVDFETICQLLSIRMETLSVGYDLCLHACNHGFGISHYDKGIHEGLDS